MQLTCQIDINLPLLEDLCFHSNTKLDFFFIKDLNFESLNEREEWKNVDTV